MSEETNQTCANCKFWAGNDGVRIVAKPSFAECRRHAPQLTRGTVFHFGDERRLEVYARDETESDRAVWPETSVYEWCGEWKEKKQ